MTGRKPTPVNHASRLTVLIPAALVILLSACGGTGSIRENSLLFRGPAHESSTTIVSQLSPPEVARAFQDAGFTDVAIRDGGDRVRVRTNTVALVNCGEIVQTTHGNRAEFPGAAPLAAIFSANGPEGLFLRGVAAVSQLDLTRSGNAYVVQEHHVVTVKYSKVGQGSARNEVKEFDAVSVAEFGDNTSCRSAGISEQLLN